MVKKYYQKRPAGRIWPGGRTAAAGHGHERPGSRLQPWPRIAAAGILVRPAEDGPRRLYVAGHERPRAAAGPAMAADLNVCSLLQPRRPGSVERAFRSGVLVRARWAGTLRAATILLPKFSLVLGDYLNWAESDGRPEFGSPPIYPIFSAVNYGQ